MKQTLVIMIEFFTDLEISKADFGDRDFYRSKSLPGPVGMYFQSNPILECIVDQCRNDPTLCKTELTTLDLLEDILTDVEKNVIDWEHDNDQLISKDDWVKKMRLSASFYWYHSQSVSEMQKYEKILLSLAAKSLQRRIILFQNDFNDIICQPLTFDPLSLYSDREYFILGFCRYLKNDRFFLSIFKAE